MAIFLRQSHNVKPPRWGSPADIEYAVKVNIEKIYDVDPDSIVLAMPLFWGLSLLDYSGKRNDGTNHGATYKDGSLSFDGDNDYVEKADNASLDIIGSITLSAQIKHSGNFTANQGVIAKYILAKRAYALYIDGTGHPGFVFSTDGTYQATNNLVSANIIPSNIQVQLTAVYNTSSIKIYVNKALDASKAGVSSSIANTTAPLRIGAQWDITPNNMLNGMLNEVHITNAAQTADQMALFHDHPYGLYWPVSRPSYFFQAAAGGVTPTGAIYGSLWGPFAGPI